MLSVGCREVNRACTVTCTVPCVCVLDQGCLFTLLVNRFLSKTTHEHFDKKKIQNK